MSYDKIILISLDTLRADGLGFNQDSLFPSEYKVKTKLEKTNLDQLAAQSCFFSNTISVAPYTSASHAAYFSGLWPKHNGLYDQFNTKLRAENIFQKFKKLGYNTSFKTDFPFVLGKYLNMIQGVDHYFVEDESKPMEILRDSKKVLSFFHFGQIHYPYGFHSLKFGGDDYRQKVNFLEKKYNIVSKKIKLEDMAVETFRDQEDLDYLYRYKKIIAHLYKNKLDNDLFDLYLEGINYFHKNKFNVFLDNLLETLKGEKYLLIIFADHGEAWNQETYGHHNSLDEGVIRVPVMFYASDVKAQYRKNRIRTIDIMPTLLKLLNVKDDSLDGESLVEMVYNKSISQDRDAFSATWVCESCDVLGKMNQIKNKDRLETSANSAVKYSAAYYQGNYKYTENYKLFANRSEKIIDFPRQQLFQINNLQDFQLIENIQVTKKLHKRIESLNSVNEKVDGIDKSDQLKKYFNLQGYNV